MQYDTIAHVGAGKCGSSAIQAYLTNHPELTTRSGKKLCYGAIGKQGFLPPAEITALRNNALNGYLSSTPSITLLKQPDTARQPIIQALRDFPHPLILSCEAWNRLMLRDPQKSVLVDLLGAGGARSIQMIMFVRPPVKWINSAWWQWGAWDRTTNLDDWLEENINRCTWIQPARAIADTKQIRSFLIRPLLGDVVTQLCESLDCEPPTGQSTVSNRSLPKEVLELYQSAPDLRPATSGPTSDFIALRALAQSNHPYGSTPWVLTPAHIRMILERTKKSNEAILDMMSEKDRAAVLADPSWWSADAYAKMHALDPSQLPPASTTDLLPLTADLMRLSRRAVRIIARHGLMDELDAPLPKKWRIEEPDKAEKKAGKPAAAGAARKQARKQARKLARKQARKQADPMPPKQK